ncbi:MAG TPA: hypothetical protein VFO16_07065 [Pseudonocardiaceae bacterium]|nr:hypothetical protein [Pseudonocardiaceae bacterium]
MSRRVKKTGTIQITGLDGQTHDVTDDKVLAGQRSGRYQTRCGRLVSAAASATPIGRRCADCIAVSVAREQAPAVHTTRRYRHRRPGWLRRILRSRRDRATGARSQ